MSDRTRNADLARVLGRPDADPLSAIEMFAPIRDLADFQLKSQAGVQAGDSLLGPAVAGATGTQVDSSFSGGTVPAAWVAVQSTLDVVNDSAGTPSLRMTSTVANDAFGVRYGYDAVNTYPTLACNPGDPIYITFNGSFGAATNDLTVHVEVEFIDSALNLGNLTFIESDLLTRGKVSDGVVAYTAYVRAPANAAFFNIYISLGYSAVNSAIGDTFLINTPVIVVGSTDVGPVLTSPGGPRQELVEAHTRLWTGHTNETSPGLVEETLVLGTTRAKDQPSLLLQSATHAAGPALLKLKGASSDATAAAIISAVSGFEALGGFSLNSVDVGRISIGASSPLLTAISTVTWMASTTLQSFANNGGRKVHIIAVFQGMLVVAVTGGTNEQVGQTLLRIYTDGGTTPNQDQVQGWSICGTGSERVSNCIFNVIPNVIPTGDIKAFVSAQWVATRAFGAGGSPNLNSLNASVQYLIIPSAQ